jgi:hypothetical protein
MSRPTRPFRTTRNPYGVGNHPRFMTYSPTTAGLTDAPLDWAKQHKWYLLGGGLLAAAAVTYFATRHSY